MEYSNTRDNEKLKKTFKGEKEKLSHMNGKEKAEYIFAYYKFPIVAILCVIAIIIWAINHALTYTDPVLYIDVLNSTYVNENCQDEITAYLELPKHERADVEASVNTEADLSSGSYYSQFDIYTIADEIDVMFTDETGAAQACDYAAVYEVADVLPEDLLELWSDKIVTMPVLDLDTEDTYYDKDVAIDISGTKVHEYFGLTDDVCYLMVSDLSGHEEYLQKFFEMLYEIETGTYTAE